MFLKPILTTYIAESVLHGYAIRPDHAICVDMHNVDVVKGLDEVGARDDLAGFVERDSGEDELHGVGTGGFTLDEGASENYGCGLG
jgi:hypothetical protein